MQHFLETKISQYKPNLVSLVWLFDFPAQNKNASERYWDIKLLFIFWGQTKKAHFNELSSSYGPNLMDLYQELK